MPAVPAGFTAIELLVAVVVIGVLANVVVPGFCRLIDQASILVGKDILPGVTRTTHEASYWYHKGIR